MINKCCLPYIHLFKKGMNYFRSYCLSISQSSKNTIATYLKIVVVLTLGAIQFHSFYCFAIQGYCYESNRIAASDIFEPAVTSAIRNFDLAVLPDTKKSEWYYKFYRVQLQLV